MLTSLRLDSACCRHLNWRTDIPPGIAPSRLEALLAAKGWGPRSTHPALRVLRHPAGHELAWVVPTGRIQIRVDPKVPHKRRRNRARTLFREVAAGLDRLLTRPSP